LETTDAQMTAVADFFAQQAQLEISPQYREELAA